MKNLSVRFRYVHVYVRNAHYKFTITENILRHRIVDSLITIHVYPRVRIELLTRFLGSFFVAICASWIFNGAPIIRIQQCTEKAVTYVLEREKGRERKRDISRCFFFFFTTLHCYAKFAILVILDCNKSLRRMNISSELENM